MTVAEVKKQSSQGETTTVETLTIKDLLEAGVHFGHQTRRWNPKMKKFIFTERNDIYIIDLKKTLGLINEACDKLRETVANGDSILFVGTKTQAAKIVKEEAERCGQFYVINRWLGGMLTNYRTIRQSVKKLEHYEKMSTDGTYELLTKKEALTNEKNKAKLLMQLGGIRDMNRIPGMLIVVDTKKENIAVREANRLGIPVCAIIDTNSDPDPIDYPIPGNDDAIRSIKVILSKLTDAILEGLQLRSDKMDVKPEMPDTENEAAQKPGEGVAETDESVFDADATEGEDSKASAKAKKPTRRKKEKETEKPEKEKQARKKTDEKKASAGVKKNTVAKISKDTKENDVPKKTVKEDDKTKTKDNE